MASLSNDPGGSRRILFVDRHGKRQAIRLGKVAKKAAVSVKLHIEQIVAAQVTSTAPPLETSRWLAGLDDSMLRKLARVDLAERPERSTLGAFLDKYLESRTDLKPNTRKKYLTTKKMLLTHFGSEKPLERITAADIDDWRRKRKVGRSENTVRKDMAVAKVLFGAAQRMKLIRENPMDGQTATIMANDTRLHFITKAEAQAVLNACPDSQWRLIFALSRFGGLRCPSEHLGLRWSDVDWAKLRIRVVAPKTEHHVGKGERFIPIFPELGPHLVAAQQEADPSAEFVITRYRETNSNLRTQLQRIIERAGLSPWPKLFQNLRSTRQTELEAEFPLHVVCSWLGNSVRVAQRHYLQVTDDHFAKAVGGVDMAQNAAQTTADSTRTPLHEEHASLQNSRGTVVLTGLWDGGHVYTVAEAGVEPARGLPPTGF